MLHIYKLFPRATKLFNIQNLSRKLLVTSRVLSKNRKISKQKIYRNNFNKISNESMASSQTTTTTNSTEESGKTSLSAEILPTNGPTSSSNLIDDRSQHLRQWEDVDYIAHDNVSECDKQGFPIVLMSYNILAQDLLQLHLYLYENVSDLDWNARLPKIAKEILKINPQILCLQEMQADHIKDVLNELKGLHFDIVFKKKTGLRTDGCAIFYNKELFSLVEKHSVEYFQPGVEQLNRENVGLIVKLCLNSDPRACIIVATTHLLYNPRRQDVRLAQIQVLLAELDRISFNGFQSNGEPQRIPIILTGDFNLKPYSAPYNLVTRGRLQYNNLTKLSLKEPDEYAQTMGNNFLPPRLGITDKCQHLDLLRNRYEGESRLQNIESGRIVSVSEHLRNEYILENQELINRYPQFFATGVLEHNLYLTSVYAHKSSNGQNEGSTFQRQWVTVDYIFYSKHFSPKITSSCEGYLQLITWYKLPSVDQCHLMGRIPNRELGSDHLSLAAKFYFQIPTKQ